MYFDTSVRAIIDILAAIDTFRINENERYFKGLNSSSFRGRLGVLFGLTESQLSAMEVAINKNMSAMSTINIITDFLLNYVFSYLKCFDSKLDIHDELNYYTEREWRIENNVNFALKDVSRVFFPQKFASKFRQDVPEYLGQITFID